MSDQALHQLMAWLSPSYPIGAFSYSHGLEYAIEAENVRNGEELRLWLTDILERGSGWNDAILLCHAFRARSSRELKELARLTEALSASRELHLETMAQGTAFAKVTHEVWGLELDPAPLPVCIGQAAAQQSIPLDTLLPLYLHGFIANIIAAGVRHVPIGQTDGQKVLASLFDRIDRISHQALTASLNDLGGICFLADLASMKHETMTTRIYRT
ncbi:urease accessory protein UreF [Coralliovum pocilloporae]|uniref:urease accessory protein UreF n=1 Tax=Coralliovum pocilloporae TaxID=3066369 RepID=UPI0033070476